MDPLQPAVLAYGPPARWDRIDLSSIRLIRVADAATAADRILADRDVVATVIVEPAYEDAAVSLAAFRASAWRVANVVSLEDDAWPTWSPWRRSLRVEAIEPSRIARDLPAILDATARRARDRHGRIDRYGADLELSRLETDLLWQRDRGVPKSLFHVAQACGAETIKDRLARLKLKTSIELDQALAEATAEL